ncbi:MAG TPA: hypothetical protein VKS01_09345, partial [Bryobacteraceae bacterium]|nr:hypothetical protein [Bryobacteraceae bacterium]
ASYAVGTVNATQGSGAITGVGTSWTTAMNGLTLRINNSPEYYAFTFAGATSATIDRPFEPPSVSGVGYRIDQNTFLLPASCRILRGVRALHAPRRLTPITPAELNALDPNRMVYGEPIRWCQTWDSATDPPIMQVELWPIPSSPSSTGNTLSFAADYVFDASDLTPGNTSSDFLPWVRPQALVEGVQASIDRWRASSNPSVAAAYLSTASAHETEFLKLLKEMQQINAMQRGPQAIKLAPELRRQVPGYYRRGPWHRGGNG